MLFYYIYLYVRVFMIDSGIAISRVHAFAPHPTNLNDAQETSAHVCIGND